MVETKEVSNGLTASSIKAPGYYSRYSDHRGNQGIGFRYPTQQGSFFLKQPRVGSATHSAAISIFTGFFLPFSTLVGTRQ
jgi:hypothetical protein